MSAPTTRFVNDLVAVELRDVFNPYADRCGLHDLPDAPLRRRRNLEISIKAASGLGVSTMWVARDLGYLGGRRTGLALTDEAHLDAYRSLFGGLPVERATKGPISRERTATTIWSLLRRLPEPVFLWNVFPLHPHDSGNPMSNRRHTAGERGKCAVFLYRIMEMLTPDRVFAIGGDAHLAVGALGIEAVQVRHPSYGGRNVFIRQIEAAYDLPPPVERDLFTSRETGPHFVHDPLKHQI